jgi:molecular chaperone HscC
MIVGIDLGTTNSLVGVWRDGKADLIPNALGSVLTPSAVSLDATGALLVGMAARERLPTHPDRTVAGFKRAMGTNKEFWLGGDRVFKAEDLSALVLKSLKEDAERFLGEPVTEAVVTVPAYFNDVQRKATKLAGELAGLKVERLLNEPTAAALAYGLQDAGAEQKILVLDLGGGTFDVSILEMFEGVMEVRATAGDNFLGGEDFAGAIAEGYMTAVGRKAGIGSGREAEAFRAVLARAAEVAKRGLTDADSHTLSLPWKGRPLDWTVTREEFERLAEPLLKRLRAPIERAIRDAKIMPSEIDHLVLAGGATRMPAFRRLAVRLFQRLPIAQVHPDEVVARGAAVQAGLKMRDASLDDVVMTDVAPFTLGIGVSASRDGQVVATGLYLPIIERNTTIPVSRSTRVSTLLDGQRTVKVPVSQGESRLIKDNVPLGELSVPVPPGPAGSQSIDIRFTYDTSGLLEIEAKVASTGATRRLVIEGQPGSLSPAEVAQRLAALAHLKVHPRDQAENQAALARAERLYAERLGEERRLVGMWLDEFALLLERQNPGDIEAFRVRLVEFLDSIDLSFFS